MTYIRNDNGSWDGKIPRIVQKLTASGALNDIVAKSELDVVVCIYAASDQATRHIIESLKFSHSRMGTCSCGSFTNSRPRRGSTTPPMQAS
jgi:hypothetical protein